ncbi:phosphomannomutase [Rhodobacter sp. NTK016B]|uniref:phosphomannomutase n=1 Tax=Rhodobacter sp. NTK016B TaxID=2759676 RepID=UPI001A8E51B0|nr:phosphomannomutase [Rhodobacter sp. NTK016B]MBN8291144.1 phosphomannomutase [Rhodobacter sp. NTK016B]
MAPKFGTSGLRGLVVELTPDLIGAHVAAFLRACPVGTGLFVGRDLRDSSPRIAGDVIAAARGAGVDVTDCGAVPTPALALAAMGAGAAAVMVTGSHIPADRNGLKFYTPGGEITKAHEAAILAALDATAPTGPKGALAQADPGPAFVARYVTALGAQALAGKRVGVWSHSAVGRDLLIDTLQSLGADVVEVARSDTFIPVDTEAVPEAVRAFLRDTAAAQGLDAIVSTDGDGDRPLVTDETGQVVPGDVLGQITAQLLGAEIAVTPVSSNTGIDTLGLRVIRTKIGSPFVIAGMERVPGTKVVGYEANGGFLLGFEAKVPTGPLPALMTRDSHLPIIAPLVAAGAGPLSARVAAEPARFTAADRLQEVPTEASAALVAALSTDAAAQAGFLAEFGDESLAGTDTTDGLRLTLASGRIVHLRPSGNAPELRFYAEAESPDAALALLGKGLETLRARLG